MKKLLLGLVAILATSQMAYASLFNASLTPDIALQKKSTKIEGFMIGVWNENPHTGFALGFVNGSTGDSQGFSLGLFNYAEEYTGAHLAAVNYTKGHFTGGQVGIANYAKKLTGVQFGVVNFAESISNGVQVGLVNIVPETKEWFKGFPKEVAPVFPFLNWRFE